MKAFLLFGPSRDYRQEWVQVAGPRVAVWSRFSVGMVSNVEGLCSRSTIFPTAFILPLGCKTIHLQKARREGGKQVEKPAHWCQILPRL